MMDTQGARRSAAFAAVGLLLLGVAAPVSAQVVYKHEYAVKAVCGPMELNSKRIAPGRYFTIVNVHNPSKSAAWFQNKVAQAGPESPTPISGWKTHLLRSDEVIALQCPQITAQMGNDWVEGFVVIQSNKPLDVVAVYTTSGREGIVNSFHTERVPARPIE